LYREAAALQPGQDFYDLFLGRALLQLATMTPGGGSTILPEDVSQTPAGDLLAVVDQGIQSRTREDLLRAANAALEAARRANPLNTDHSANLARLHRAWAFADVTGVDPTPSNQLLRDLVREGTAGVDRDKLEQAAAFYEEAVRLSPQNTQLYNELATVQYILGDDAGALATLDRSLALDSRFSQTYLLQGDALSALGDKAAALEAYRQAAALAPGDLNIQSAIGVTSAELGQTDTALAAFRQILDSDAQTLAAAEAELGRLDAEASAAGGYKQMPVAAREQRDRLNAQIAESRSQLHLSHRNMALVLRDADRTDEALAAAQQALSFANDAQRAAIEALIEALQDERGG
jgi:tetratricopeptide (TPR) repeat protein